MLISNRKQFIYTKTFKTAGTSVESYFEPYCMPEGEWVFSHPREEYVNSAGIIGYRGSDLNLDTTTWWNHMPAELIEKKLGRSKFEKYFKFCVIRNPFDKAISAFHFLNKDLIDLGRYREQGQPYLNMLFTDWLKLNIKILIDRDKYMIGNDICMDFFIRFESLEDGIRNVCKILEIRFDATRIPKLKVGNRFNGVPLVDYYNKESLDMLSTEFEFEIEYFGYTAPY